MKDKFPSYYDPKRIPATFSEMSVDVIKTENERIISRWFHGANSSDLLIWTNEKKNIIKQQVIFCGQITEWNIIEGIKTGYILEEEASKDSLPHNESIRYDDRVQNASVQMALELLKNISVLEESIKTTLIEHFEKPQSIHSLSAADFVKQYGNTKGQRAWFKFRKFCQKLFN